MNTKTIKVLEMVLPNNKLINDNVNGNYKQRMGIFKWIHDQVILGLQEGCEKVPTSVCRVTPRDKVWEVIGKPGENKITMVYSHFKVQRSFDVQNYCATFKYMVDVLTSNDYWEDDSHRCVNSVILTGGDQLNLEENNILGLEDRIYEVGPKKIIEEYIPDDSPYRKGKCKKTTDYDVFQLYAIVKDESNE